MPRRAPNLRRSRPFTKTQIAPEPPGDIHYRDRRLIVMYLDMTAMPIRIRRALASALKFIKARWPRPI